MAEGAQEAALTITRSRTHLICREEGYLDGSKQERA
jgi:hypothetical protein